LRLYRLRRWEVKEIIKPWDESLELTQYYKLAYIYYPNRVYITSSKDIKFTLATTLYRDLFLALYNKRLLEKFKSVLYLRYFKKDITKKE
jgi:hypothetical protein